MNRLQDLTAAYIHMNAARQTRIEAAHGAHDVDAFEFVRSVLFEDGCVLNRIFVRAGCSIDVARAAIPRRRRVRMVICDLAISNHDMKVLITAAATAALLGVLAAPAPLFAEEDCDNVTKALEEGVAISLKDFETTMRAMFAEPFGFVPKPYTPDDLKTALSNLLSQDSAASGRVNGTGSADSSGRRKAGVAG